MIRNYLWCTAVVVLFAACGGDDDGDEGGSGGMMEAGADSGATGGRSGTGGSASSCDETPCEGVMFNGQSLATCCRSATACGVSAGGMCIDPDMLPSQADGGTEVIVPDENCADLSFDAMGFMVELTGCCDASGVCGVSTESVAAQAGFPVQCITPMDAVQQFGMSLPGEAGMERPCDYPVGEDAGPDAADAAPDASSGKPDGGSPDATTGTPDAAPPDASTSAPDATPPDAGGPDAG